MTRDRRPRLVRPLAGLVLVALLGLGFTLLSRGAADAIELPDSDDPVIAALSECEPGSSALVAVAAGTASPSGAAVVADFVDRLGRIGRDVEVLVVSGAEPEVLSEWTSVGSATADRVAGFLAGPTETTDEPADDPDVSSGAIDLAQTELAERGEELASDGFDSCGLTVVVDSGASDDGAADGNVVVVAGDHREAAAELEAVVASLGEARASITPLGVCAEEGCPEGSATVDVDPLLGRFAFTVLLPDEPVQVVVGLPRGIELPVDPSGGPIDAGSFTLTTTWVTPQVLRLEAAVSPLDDDWPGDWTVTVIAPEAAEPAPSGSAHLMTAVAAGLEPRVVGTPRLVADREVLVDVELYDRDGRFVQADEVPGDVEVRAVVVDADGAEVASSALEPTEIGLWRGPLTAVDVDGQQGPYRLQLVVDATDSVGSLPSRRTTVAIDVLGSEAIPVLESSTARLRGDAGDTATGALVVVAGQGVDACVWLADGSDPGVVIGDGAVSPASCVSVPAGEAGSVPVSVDAADFDAGIYSATAVVALGVGDGSAAELVDVELTVEVLAQVDAVRRLAIAVALGLAGLLLPLLALWVFDASRARFRPSKAAVSIDVGVVVRSDGSLYRADDATSPLILSDDMCEPVRIPRGRRFEWSGLHFAVRNPLSPFRPPVAVVGSPEGPVVAHMGAVVDDDNVVGRVVPGLGSTWIFVLDPEATRVAASKPSAPDFFSAHGRLVLIRSSPDADPVDIAALSRQAQRLAHTVRSVRPDAQDGDEPAREMLDFVDVNVSTPRDLPRRKDPAAEAAQELPSSTISRWEDLPDWEDVEVDELYSDPFEDSPDRDGDLDLPVWEPGGKDPAGRVEDDDEWDEPGAHERSSGRDDTGEDGAFADGAFEDAAGGGIGFGIVFEEGVNPQAFLDAGEPPGGSTGPGPASSPDAPDAAAGSSEPDDTPEPDGLGWARRSRPLWPTARKRDDS